MHDKPAEGLAASQGAAHRGLLPSNRSTKPPGTPPVNENAYVELLAANKSVHDVLLVEGHVQL